MMPPLQGPWRIELDQSIGAGEQWRVVCTTPSGSTIHDVVEGTAMRGDAPEWSIDVQLRSDASEWMPARFVRAVVTFDVQLGFVIAAGWTATDAGLRTFLSLRLVAEDPALDPLDEPPPFEVLIPG